MRSTADRQLAILIFSIREDGGLAAVLVSFWNHLRAFEPTIFSAPV
jgi:hypothetical protein